MPSLLAFAGLAATVFGTVSSQSAARKQQQASERAIEAQEAQQQIRQDIERRRVIREARQQRAAAQQAAVTQGAGTGSGIAGGLGSIQSQLATNLSFLDTQAGLSEQVTGANIAFGKAGLQRRTGQAIAGFGSTIFNQAGGFGTIFDAVKTPTQEEVR